MMEQGSSIAEKEGTEMMNVQEVARLIEWLRASGISEMEINNCVTYIATGVGLSTKESAEVKENN